MKKLIAAIALTLVSASAFADVVVVPYGSQWTDLPNCGGQTRLVCDDVDNARKHDRCRIEFQGSYGCDSVNLYTAYNFQPKGETVSEGMQGSYYVDHTKVNYDGTFRIYMQNDDRSAWQQVLYKFAY